LLSTAVSKEGNRGPIPGKGDGREERGRRGLGLDPDRRLRMVRGLSCNLGIQGVT